MPGSAHIPVSFAVEGDADEAVARKLAAHVGVGVHQVLGRQGKHWILKRLRGLNDSAKGQPWFVLIDLNGDAPCAVEFVRSHLPHPSRFLRFRIAVRAVEAWLLADRSGFARFLGVRTTLLPKRPDTEPDPKATVIELARRSNKSRVQQGMPPRPASGRRTGDLYNALLIEFVHLHWELGLAREHSSSLDRAILRLSELAQPQAPCGSG